jgi:hypothetical protein
MLARSFCRRKEPHSSSPSFGCYQMIKSQMVCLGGQLPCFYVNLAHYTTLLYWMYCLRLDVPVLIIQRKKKCNITGHHVNLQLTVLWCCQHNSSYLSSSTSTHNRMVLKVTCKAKAVKLPNSITDLPDKLLKNHITTTSVNFYHDQPKELQVKARDGPSYLRTCVKNLRSE